MPEVEESEARRLTEGDTRESDGLGFGEVLRFVVEDGFRSYDEKSQRRAPSEPRVRKPTVYEGLRDYGRDECRVRGL